MHTTAVGLDRGNQNEYSFFMQMAKGEAVRVGRVRAWVRARRVPLVVAALLIGVGWLMLFRPWSQYSGWRQMHVFDPEKRVHNFQAMDELFPARPIHRGATPHAFGESLRDLPKTYRFGGRDESTEAFLDRSTTTALLVLKGDTIQFERYYRGADRGSALTSWSVAKSVVSTLVGIALDEGAIASLDDVASKYAPELQGSAYGEVPLRHLLTMSSGVRFTEDYKDALSDIHLMFARLFVFGDHGESVGHYLASRPREAAARARFYYASADTLALGLALRGAVHMPLTSYLEQKLWQPLGMEYDATWNVDGDGTELAFCCLNVRLRDYAKIGRLVARGGDWDGRRIVSQDWVHQATRPDAIYPPGSLPRGSFGYQYQWWIPAGSHGIFTGRGVWGQSLWVNPSHDLVIVKTSVDPDFMRRQDETEAVLEAIDAAMSGPT
jgi:CubicO group peptidase (beta-lactamase class C family)